MDTIIYLLIGAGKILVLLVGLVMLLGGGICVVMDISIFSSNPDSDAFIIIGIACLVTLLGLILSYSVISSFLPSSKNNQTTQHDDREDQQ